jgi:hypothetical protein
MGNRNLQNTRNTIHTIIIAQVPYTWNFSLDKKFRQAQLPSYCRYKKNFWWNKFSPMRAGGEIGKIFHV